MFYTEIYVTGEPTQELVDALREALASVQTKFPQFELDDSFDLGNWIECEED